jgi:hypothetical protein
MMQEYVLFPFKNWYIFIPVNFHRGTLCWGEMVTRIRAEAGGFGFKSTLVGTSEVKLHKQLYRWSWSHFSKPFDKINLCLKCALRTPRRMRWSREIPLFLAPSHPKALWEHIFRGFIGGAILFYPVWHKTALNGFWSRWRSRAKRGLSPDCIVLFPKPELKGLRTGTSRLSTSGSTWLQHGSSWVVLLRFTL